MIEVRGLTEPCLPDSGHTEARKSRLSARSLNREVGALRRTLGAAAQEPKYAPVINMQAPGRIATAC